MDRETLCSKYTEAIEQFNFEGSFVSCEKYGNGHINDTFLVTFRNADGSNTRYILQRINSTIFNDPDAVMGNICNVTAFLKEKIKKNGGDVMRETMNVIMTYDGKAYYADEYGSFWRTYVFIENATSFDQVEKPEDFYQSAYAFGTFQYLLSDFDASQLKEVIADFHNTPVRFERFKKVLAEDKLGRAKDVQAEIDFMLDHEADMRLCKEMLDKGELPLRVTHNDTKLNNVMIDDATGKGLCVIDLDTVMPGLAIYDFGDSIRFGANTASEDETDLSKVKLSLELFETYAKGFLAGCRGSLTANEMKMLPMGAKTMTLECGMRFLTDYLEGDVYFKIHRPNHNLDRARTQIKLVQEMEANWDKMEAVIAKLG